MTTPDGQDEAARTPKDTRPDELGPSALRGLAHPLRVRILDLLSTSGPLTASGLANLVGESSGSTSYHLRQLAKHGFVHEVEGKGTGRERWWQRSRAHFSINTDVNDDAGIRVAKGLVNAEFERTRQEKIWALMQAMDSPERFPEWRRASTLTTVNGWATPEQLHGIITRVTEVIDAEVDALRTDERSPEARPVQIHFNAFPVLGVPGNPETGTSGERATP